MSAPHTWTVDHIGIAVPNLDIAIALYASTAGTSVTSRERLTDRGVELAFLNTGGTRLELLMPLRDDTPIARFLAKRGPGLHHICYKVDDIVREMERLQQLGAKLIDTTPRPGASGTRIAFLEPQSFSGVLTELCEYTGC
ncbi:MAG: methylmalonyl-CoA epimerase [Pseudomonadota bacterium]|jgi:methylmalonyl-CoA epimerase